MMKKYAVTRDSGANLKILKRLEKEGYIKIFDVMLENGRENRKVKEKILPVAVWDHASWDEAVWASEECTYDDIRKIIGVKNVKDAMQLEAHIRSKHDFFVTEDTDFLKKRDELEKKFGVKIVTPEELKKMSKTNKEKQNIPKGWNVKPLGEISEVTNGSTNTQDAVEDGEYPFFDRSVDVKRSDKYLFDDIAIILPGEGAEFVPKYYKGKFDLHQRAYAIFPNEEIDPDYLFHYLYSNRKEFVKKSVGSTVRSLRLPLIQSVEVLFPKSKIEQQKIAEILSAVDEKISVNKKLLAKQTELKKGMMQDLLSGVKRVAT